MQASPFWETCAQGTLADTSALTIDGSLSQCHELWIPGVPAVCKSSLSIVCCQRCGQEDPAIAKSNSFQTSGLAALYGEVDLPGKESSHDVMH